MSAHFLDEGNGQFPKRRDPKTWNDCHFLKYTRVVLKAPAIDFIPKNRTLNRTTIIATIQLSSLLLMC
jgi:hypothetical protein